jgi:CIC family chloride channel protein
VVLEDAPLRKVLGQFKGSRQTAFPVVTPDLGLVGMLTYQEISRALDDAGLMDILIAADLTAEGVETVTPRDSLLDAMRLMGVRGLDYLPVIESPEQPKLLGLLSRGQIMDAYQTRLLFESPGPRPGARLRGRVGA